jgi:DNA repair protein RadC
MTRKRSSSTCDIAAFLAALQLDKLGDAERAKLVELALVILRECHTPGETITDPRATRDYLQLWLHDRPNEIFGVVFLDNRHRVIATEELFRGSIDGASVYPRVVVQEALKCNAAAVIFFHNHPSGVAEPSAADTRITQRLKDALALVDVRVLDHVVVGHEDTVSMAESGLL